MSKRHFALASLAALLLSPGIHAQKHQVGLTLGNLFGASRSSPLGGLSLGGGPGWQANYGYRLTGGPRAALYGEFHFLANGLREIESPNRAATRDVATLYATPGVRLKFRPEARLAPYVAAGAGYGLYEQSLFRIDGQSNPAPRFTHRGVVVFGGGVDFRVWRWLGARWEVRDFYSGNPSYNAAVSGGQHNVMVGGGFTLNFQ
jgi:opacity protein-like surface antigen